MDLPRDRDYRLQFRVVQDHLQLLRGDITELRCDAIVNAANSDLLPGGGLCGAINYKGGPEIARECARLRRLDGPVRPGRAVATTGGRLPAQYIIHAVGPVWEGGIRGEAKILANCYCESMRVAESLHLRSIAFPAISTGIYRYPTQEAAEVAIVAVLTSMPATQHLRQVIFSLFDKPTFDAFVATALASEMKFLANLILAKSKLRLPPGVRQTVKR